MGANLREIIKKVGLTQQELADFLGITRQYLNSYLDETLENPQLPPKYSNSILFLFECKTMEELYNPDFNRSSKAIRKRMNMIKSTKESMENLFNVENEKKFEIFKIFDSFKMLTKFDDNLLEAFSILLENMVSTNEFKALLSYIGKRYMIIDFNDPDYIDSTNKAREALLFKAFEAESLDFSEYESLYEEFENKTKRHNNIDLEALKISLNELGYTNISQKEVIDILIKYNQLKKDEKE